MTTLAPSRLQERYRHNENLIRLQIVTSKAVAAAPGADKKENKAN